MAIVIVMAMPTVQMTMDSELLARVDQVARKLRTTRSSFTRDALRSALQRHEEAELEARHVAGYRQHPTSAGEFDVPEGDRAWGDNPWNDSE